MADIKEKFEAGNDHVQWLKQASDEIKDAFETMEGTIKENTGKISPAMLMI